MSILSSSGPEIRFWYFVTIPGAQVQGFCESPQYHMGMDTLNRTSFSCFISGQKIIMKAHLKFKIRSLPAF
jgi:hypothetical protein